MKHLLEKCVAEEQSDFIEGRSILDNAMIGFEVIHTLKRQTRGNRSNLALKIDISKAYDKVDWGFLRGVLSRLGFEERWIHWIMMCVTSVHYTVLVNSDQAGPIEPGRGLRQGDPLSPYSIILVTEGLSKLMTTSVARGDVHGIQICRGAPTVSHLLFADDCFLFCRANLTEVRNIMKVIQTYAEASGQEINLTKLEVFFSRNLSKPAQEDLAGILGVCHVFGTGKYLGLPSMIGRSKKATFSYIKDRIWNRINSWKGRSLSKAGKEIMIKSVLQAIPSYIMTLFIIPASVIQDIERMLNAFWWGGGKEGAGIRWMAWDRLACPKEYGGLGFRDFNAFNMAMVAKQGWSLTSNPDALVSRIFKARYFPNNSFFDSSLGYNLSFIWRSIWKSREVLTLGCRWSIGDGSIIKIMQEPWIRGSSEEVVRDLFDAADSEKILKVPLLEEVRQDMLIWKEEQYGIYSVKIGYNLWYQAVKSNKEVGGSENWGSIWNIKAPPRVKHLLWRICVGCLPTRFQDIKSLLLDICSKEDKEVSGRLAVMIYVIWKNRNDYVWQNEKEDATTLGVKAIQIWNDWGWCVRNHLGNFIYAGTSLDPGTLPVFEAEALPLKEAILGAISSHLEFVSFESDSQIVTQAIHSNRKSDSEFYLIIESIRSLLLSFPNFEVKFVKRQANSVAHSLARAANSWARRSMLVSISHCIEHILINELH
ncbi:uncharacterized protein LOC131613882 [Vicia villosa]|uniref:uncharacterized protein LOC131613882 n=1 Tax=Vicia villosa TaxID=3911 RepID=UPI00273B692F|nr:uncharacterized protein LOC131613882 [Vicia villosa]